MQVKRKLVAEFGNDTFETKKEHVRTVMQQIEMQRMDRPQENDVDARDRTASFILERPPGSYALGSCGEYLWVKVRRPTRHSLGFTVVGGSDKAHGGTFVQHVGSTSAGELHVCSIFFFAYPSPPSPFFFLQFVLLAFLGG